jgi:hypothetical protein
MTRLVLRISAVYFGLLALASLTVPKAAASGLDQPMTSFDVFTARTIGAILLAFAVATWSGSARASRGILAANAILNASLAAIDITAIASGTIGATSWSGVAAHLVLLSAILLGAARQRRAQRAGDAL